MSTNVEYDSCGYPHKVKADPPQSAEPERCPKCGVRKKELRRCLCDPHLRRTHALDEEGCPKRCNHPWHTSPAPSEPSPEYHAPKTDHVNDDLISRRDLYRLVERMAGMTVTQIDHDCMGEPFTRPDPKPAEVYEHVLKAIVSIERRASGEQGAAPNDEKEFYNPTRQVMFRAGLLACREYMARFVEAESPSIATSIRANWWPNLGPDPGKPRKLRFDEVTDGGEEGPWPAKPIEPSVEALPVAEAFLVAARSQPGSEDSRG